MGKTVGKAVEGRQVNDRNLAAHVLQKLMDARAADRIIFEVRTEIENGKFQLARQAVGKRFQRCARLSQVYSALASRSRETAARFSNSTASMAGTTCAGFISLNLASAP